MRKMVCQCTESSPSVFLSATCRYSVYCNHACFHKQISLLECNDPDGKMTVFNGNAAKSVSFDVCFAAVGL